MKDISKILANPFYCLKKVDPIFCLDHEVLVTESEWVASNIKLIDDIGSGEFLYLLLEILKGEYITSLDNQK